MPRSGTTSGGWTFLTNHAHILICLARRPDAVLREVAAEVGITERAVHNIVSDLEASGVLKRERDGRRNHYDIDLEKSLRHPVEAHCSVGQLIDMVLKLSPDTRHRRRSASRKE
jgi:DNA-binding transcriptional regulator PaaX